MLKRRIEKIELKLKPVKIACFSVIKDIASGRAWWNDVLKWDNLTRREYEQLQNDLIAEGVKIIEIFSIDGNGQQI